MMLTRRCIFGICGSIRMSAQVMKPNNIGLDILSRNNLRQRGVLNSGPAVYVHTKDAEDHSDAFDSERQTHFGFDRVGEKEKAQKVYSVFSSVAEKYDLMNDVMSIGIHRLWKDRLLAVLHPTPATRLLDVAGGTGDIAFRFINAVRHLEATELSQTTVLLENPFDASYSPCSDEINETVEEKRSHVVVCDINDNMLQVGKKRAEQQGFTSNEISWIKGDAENLPFDNNSFDAYTIAFGIRNVVHIDQALTEAHRVLKPGGRFLCLEFSQVQNPVLERLYNTYSFQVIPVLGQLFAHDWRSYQYLVESIRQFPSQEDFCSRIKAAGFSFPRYENLSSGIAAIHTGFKFS